MLTELQKEGVQDRVRMGGLLFSKLFIMMQFVTSLFDSPHLHVSLHG